MKTFNTNDDILNIEICNNCIRKTKSFKMTPWHLDDLLSTWKLLKITSRRIENCLSMWKYNGSKKDKDDEVEKAEIPPMIIPFYKYILNNENIPSPDDFINSYFSFYNTVDYDISKVMILNSLENKKYILNKEKLIGRLLRAYPSIMRDFHCYLKLVESDKFKYVKYSCANDYFDGIDIKIMSNNNEWYSLRLSIDTSRSNKYNNDKIGNRHEDNTDIKDAIELKLKEDNKLLCGDFWLYKIEFVLSEIKRQINNGQGNN